MFLFHPIHMLFYLLTCFLTAYLGAKLAEKAGLSKLVGALIGLVFHLPGLVGLLIVWAVTSAKDEAAR